jgi:hypothetical protein
MATRRPYERRTYTPAGKDRSIQLRGAQSNPQQWGVVQPVLRIAIDRGAAAASIPEAPALQSQLGQ